VLQFNAATLAAEVRELTAGEGVDVVYDSVGRLSLEASLDSLRPRGLLVSFGGSSGAPAAIEVATLNAKGSLFVTRPSLAAHTRTVEEYQAAAQRAGGARRGYHPAADLAPLPVGRSGQGP
jgi:NADPH2:quinone reductase